MRETYIAQLERLQQDLNIMYAICKKQLVLCKEMINLSLKVSKKPSKKTNKKQSEILEQSLKNRLILHEKQNTLSNACELILLLQQPVAFDLAQITTTFRYVVQLERIGELTNENLKIAMRLSKTFMIESIISMAQILSDMFVLVEQTEVSKQTNNAESNTEHNNSELFKKQKRLDSAFSQTRSYIAKKLQKSKGSTQQLLDVMMIAVHFENIGDYIISLAKK